MDKYLKAEKSVEELSDALPPAYTWETDIYLYIGQCADLMNVKPAELNLAIGCVCKKIHANPAEITRELMLIFEYLRNYKPEEQPDATAN